MAVRACTECGASFTTVKRNEYRKQCGSCHYERYRLIKLSKKYGITIDQYLDMHAAQGGCCAVCGIHESELPKRLHVDHDHDCCPIGGSCGECVRGLLCAKCNTSMGQFESDPELLLKAYEYLTGGQ